MKDVKMSTHLSGGRLNVALVQETMRTEFLDLLEQIKGPKVNLYLGGKYYKFITL